MEPDGRSMRDSQTKNSPTSVPLPLSPSSTGEFDALIDLLASDEVSRPSLNPNVRASGSQPNLRDANGQLDFSKMRSMFASSINRRQVRNPQTSTIPQNSETERIEANLPFSRADIGKFSTRSSPIRTTAISTLNLSTAPRTAINTGLFDVGLPPAESTPIPAARVLQGDNLTGPHAFSLAGIVQPELCGTPSQDDPESSTSLLALKNALDLAQHEIMDLRKRCRELEDLQATSDISLSKDDPEIGDPRPPASSGHKPQALDVNQTHRNPRSTPTSDDIRRALELVTFVDELVWKRSKFGAKYEYPYGSENIQALQERLELWEQTVRTRR